MGKPKRIVSRDSVVKAKEVHVRKVITFVSKATSKDMGIPKRLKHKYEHLVNKVYET